MQTDGRHSSSFTHALVLEFLVTVYTALSMMPSPERSPMKNGSIVGEILAIYIAMIDSLKLTENSTYIAPQAAMHLPVTIYYSVYPVYLIASEMQYKHTFRLVMEFHDYFQLLKLVGTTCTLRGHSRSSLGLSEHKRNNIVYSQMPPNNTAVYFLHYSRNMS